MRTSNGVLICAALLGFQAGGAQAIDQPPEAALRNLTAEEKLAIVHDLMSATPARDLADNDSSDVEACRAIAETFSAGEGIKFLEPNIMTTTARPDELRTIEGQCPALVLDQATLPKAGAVRARRNFSLYFIPKPIAGMAMSVFMGERWCKESAGARTPCAADQTVKAFDINSCKIITTEILPPRSVAADGKSNYIQGLVEYRNDYYIANIGDVCAPDQAKNVSGYAFDISAVEQVNGAPKLRCSLSTPAKARCAPARK